MFSNDLSQVLLWAIALAGTIWSLGPPLVFALFGHGFLFFRAIEDPNLAKPEDHNAEAQFWVSELSKLGFRPVGMIRESCWFSHVIHWVTSFEVHYLVSVDGKTWASWYRLFPGDYLRIGLTTYTEKSGYVKTHFPGLGMVSNDPMVARNDYRQGTPVGLLAEHQNYAEAFLSQHQVRPLSVSLAEYAELDKELDQKTVQTIDQSGNYLLPGFLFVAPAVACYLFLHFYYPMQVPTMVAGALGVGSVVYLGFMKLIFPQLLHIGKDGEYGLQDEA